MGKGRLRGLGLLAVPLMSISIPFFQAVAIKLIYDGKALFSFLA